MKKAFTLAEVLITLAIVGIVATMTIPTLTTKYRYKSYETSLFKAKSMFAQATQMLLIQNGISKLSHMEIFRECYDQPCGELPIDFSPYIKLKPYMSDTPIEYKSLNGDSSIGMTMDCTESGSCWQTANGMIFKTYARTNKPVLSLDNSYVYIDISIDINGKKGPNTLGRDSFGLRIGDTGKVYGYGEKDLPHNDIYDLFEPAHWTTTCNTSPLYSSTKDFVMKTENITSDEFDTEWNSLTEEEKAQLDQDTQLYNAFSTLGFNCAGRIFEKGKMDY